MSMSVYNFDYDKNGSRPKPGETLAKMPYKAFRDGFRHPAEERSLKLGSVAVWTGLAAAVAITLIIGDPLPYWS